MSKPRSPARRAFLRRALGAALAGAAVPGVAAPSRLARSDWRAIRKLITQQLAALRAGDAERAFGYASPGIRAQFGDAQTFLAMVRGAYAALLDARYTEFLEGAVSDGLIVQPLRLVARDNTVQVALYTLEKLPGGWCISGCRLAPSSVQAA
jgi:hypothetical protein